MTRRKRRNHSPAFNAKVALAAVKGERTVAELAMRLPTFRVLRLHDGSAPGWPEFTKRV